MSVLSWVQNNKAWKQYVGTRIKEICQLTDRDHWLHCPGILNPANLPLRGLSASQLVNRPVSRHLKYLRNVNDYQLTVVAQHPSAVWRP